MRTHNLTRSLLAGFALVVSTVAFAAQPTPFTAVYQVSSQGEMMGQATITLKSLGNGEYEYSNQMHGTSGLAAMLGANASDVTRFRWNNNAPETETYSSKTIALKTKLRTMHVNWNNKEVTVDEGKGPTTYPAVPGMIDRNTIPYAVGLALRHGSQSVTLPVGSRQQVEQQQFKVEGTETVKVPAGSFKTERVTRTDSNKHFDAWYAKQYPLPVKLAQSEGGDVELQLVRFSSP